MNAEKTLSNIEPISLAEGSPVTRPSPKLVYNRDGMLVQVPANMLAVTYDPSDLSKAPYPVVELQPVTNLITASEQLDNAAWAKFSYFVTPNVVKAPNGQMAADIIGPTADVSSFSTGVPLQTIAKAATAVRYTLSAFVSPVGIASAARICPYGGGVSNTASVVVDLATGQILAAPSTTGTFTNASAQPAQWISSIGMWRVNLSFTSGPEANIVPRIFPYTGLNAFNGDGVSGLAIWGVMLNEGDLSSYTPDTRAADVIGPNYGLIYSTLVENDVDDAPLYDPTKTYAAGARVRRAETHQVYQSAVAGNIGNTPELNASGSAAKWTKVRPTNRWAMFDGSVGTASEADSVLTVVLRPGAAIDSIYGVVDADRAQVCVQDALGGNIIFQNTIELEASAPSDWDEYFWDPFKPLPDFLITDLDPYYECVVTLTLSKTSGTVGCPGLVLGTHWKLGATQYGVKVKPKSYSYVGEDDYGNTTIVPRKKSTDLSGTAWLDRTEASYVNQLTQRMLDVPAVWIASSNPEDFALRCYGLGSLEISYDYPEDCQLSFNVKGVINAAINSAA
jgi:hypothetical protein